MSTKTKQTFSRGTQSKAEQSRAVLHHQYHLSLLIINPLAEVISSSAVSTFITDRRFREMDWDHDGTITFKEFLMAFQSWVGVDESTENLYSDEDLDDLDDAERTSLAEIAET